MFPGSDEYNRHDSYIDAEYIFRQTRSSSSDDDAAASDVDAPVDAPAGTTTVAHAADDFPAFASPVSLAELEEAADDAAEAAALDDTTKAAALHAMSPKLPPCSGSQRNGAATSTTSLSPCLVAFEPIP